jgi:hypothetical protein
MSRLHRNRRGLTLPARAIVRGVVVSVGVLAAGCGAADPPAPATQASVVPAAAYPAPRFPSYLKPPSGPDELLTYARRLAQNRRGLQGAGFGIIEKGDTVLWVASTEAEDVVLAALKQAVEERGGRVIVKRDYEMAGVPRDEALVFKQDAAAIRRVPRSYTSEFGYKEAANWVDAQFPDPAAAKAWLRGRRPDLYDALFPAREEMTPRQREIYEKFRGEHLGVAIREYLDAHPEIRGVFWGFGGSTSLRRYLRPAEDKLLGLFVFENHWDLMSQVGTYPGDVWQLAEEQAMEPLVHVDRLDITDPEGTDLDADISEEMARNWARGVYQRGHLYMLPNQATGRFGYSVVDYPAFQQEWLPREPMALPNGTIGGTVNHTGFFPHWTVTVKDGYVRGVEGGGLFGEALREFLQYPHSNDQVFPYHNPDHPGYWWLYETALGTHPKGFRNPSSLAQGSALVERNRAGVFHWGLGVTLHHDPGERDKSQKLIDFTAQYNLPRDHGWHTHTYLTTYRVRLRNANQWVAIVDKGRLKSLDNAEVRALASRYGNPDALLEEDWRPNIPGINMPGRYEEYSASPWTFVKGALDEVNAGRYAFFYPPEGGAARATSSAGGQ